MDKTSDAKDYDKQEIDQNILDRAKAECEFTDQLYDILLAYQRGRVLSGRPSSNIPPGNVGDLNPAMSRLYNQIWLSVIGFNEKAKPKKNKQQMEVTA